MWCRWERISTTDRLSKKQKCSHFRTLLHLSFYNTLRWVSPRCSRFKFGIREKFGYWENYPRSPHLIVCLNGKRWCGMLHCEDEEKNSCRVSFHERHWRPRWSCQRIVFFSMFVNVWPLARFFEQLFPYNAECSCSCRVDRQTFMLLRQIPELCGKTQSNKILLDSMHKRWSSRFVLWKLTFVLRSRKTNSFLVVVVALSLFETAFVKESNRFPNARFNTESTSNSVFSLCQQTHLLITLQPYICPIVCNPIGLIPLHFDINKAFLSSEYVSHRLDIAAWHVLLLVASCRCFYIQFFFFLSR